MRAPRHGIDLDDTVICRPTISSTPIMQQIMSAEWHVGYGQWHFNKDDKDGLEFYEKQIIYYWHPKKNKWVSYDN